MKSNISIAFRHLLFLCLGVLVLSYTGCKDDDVYVDQYLRVDANSFTIDAEGVRKYTVTVASSTPWTIKSDGDAWLTVGDVTESSFTISAEPNTTGASRPTTVIIANGINPDVKISVTQTASAAELPDFYDFGNAQITMSKNGTYVAYVAADIVDGDFVYTPVKLNMITGEETKYPQTSQGLTKAVVSDNGALVLTDEGNLQSYLCEEDGSMTLITIDGYSMVMVTGMSSDGSIMVGFAYKQSEWKYYPIKWTNKVPEPLELPATNILGNPLSNGAMARGCSADGSVIYGSEWAQYTPMVWKNGKVMTIGAESVTTITGMIEFWGMWIESTFYNHPRLQNETTNISPNGRYLAMTYTRYVPDDEEKGTVKSSDCPILFDLEDGSFKLFDTFGNYGARTAMDDGSLSYSSPVSLSDQGYIYTAGTDSHETTEEWMLRKHGIVVPKGMLITSVSPDGKTICGMKLTVAVPTYYFNYYAIRSR